jgi:hypothetical protein
MRLHLLFLNRIRGWIFMRKWLLKKMAKSDFVCSAVKNRADLSAFKQRPSLRIIIGIAAIALSFPLGWPSVSVLGTVSLYFREPLIVLIGGPVVYGLSHLVFIAGMYLAGAEYSRIFLQWATRVWVEKLLADPEDNRPENP